MELLYSVLAVYWGFFRPSPSCLKGKASICLPASLTSCPIRAGINWSLMAFSSSLNESLVSGTFLWKWVHLEHNPFCECWVRCLRIILCVIGEQLKVFHPTLNVVCNELFPKWFYPNYCSKVAFILVCDFDASFLKSFFSDFFKLLFFVMRVVFAGFGQYPKSGPWPLGSPTIFDAF